jgi:chromosome partitioning protein
MSILDYRPDLGEDYLAVADELLKRLGLDRPRRRLRELRRDSAEPAPSGG